MAIKQKLIDKYGARILKRSALSIRDGEGVFRQVLEGRRDCVVLEIGTFRGFAAACMSQWVKQVITIDLRNGQLERQGDQWDRQAMWDMLGCKNITLFLVEDNAEKEALVNTLSFDFAFIDGDHGPGVELDFKLVRRCGEVLFHDYDDSGRAKRNVVYDFVNTLGGVEVLDIFALWKGR